MGCGVKPGTLVPLEFIVEPEAGTLTPDTSKDVNLPVVSGRSIATTVWVYNEYFSKASADFENEAPPARPTNHFYVNAIENCTVKLYHAGEYKIDDQ